MHRQRSLAVAAIFAALCLGLAAPARAESSLDEAATTPTTSTSDWNCHEYADEVEVCCLTVEGTGIVCKLTSPWLNGSCYFHDYADEPECHWRPVTPG